MRRFTPYRGQNVASPAVSGRNATFACRPARRQVEARATDHVDHERVAGREIAVRDRDREPLEVRIVARSRGVLALRDRLLTLSRRSPTRPPHPE
jgi:hypothetical protein